MALSRLHEEVRTLLKQVGWSPRRRICSSQILEWGNALEQSSQFHLFEAARHALLEFGDLTIERSGLGVHCARSGFEINPLLALGEKDRFLQHEAAARTKLFPLGEVRQGHAFLAIGENGAVFILMEELVYLGKDIHSALENLLQGIRLPMPT